ncbi:MAG: glycoside hydrolase family 2, partial [Bacteroidetes bacterium]|nr:glycoside hydrolase family 2 [Bacteroidota bacterium]
SEAGRGGKECKAWGGKKDNGDGNGYFEYTIPITDKNKLKQADEAYVLLELSAKEFFVKDQEEFNRNQDYMKGSRVAPSSNPNSYPMTDETTFPSNISIWINGEKALSTILKDDPADHRGVLSWHHQLKDRKLREAGSYGYLIRVPVDKNALKNSKLKVEIRAEGEGGVAVYGKEFGRYPFDPSLVVKM